MRIVSIAFGRTLSDKDFGGFRGDCSAEIAGGDCLQSAMNEMKAFVLKNLNDDILEVKGQSNQQELPIKEEIEKPVKKVAKKVAKKAAKKATKKVANVAYDRNLQPHKTLFLAMAQELGLRSSTTPEAKKALKETSEFMEGKEMFEAGSTEILQEFKDMALHNFKDFKKQFEVAV